MLHVNFFLDNTARRFVAVSDNPRPYLGPNNWLWKYLVGQEDFYNDADVKLKPYLLKYFGDVLPVDRMVTVDDNKPYYVIGRVCD